MKRVLLLPSFLLASLSVTALTSAAVGNAQTSPASPEKTAQQITESSVKDNSEYVMCKNRKIVRTIRVEKDNSENECVTFYTKSGVDKEVGRAKSKSSCVKIMDNIRVNLDNAGWKCKGVDNVGFTSNASSDKTEE